MPFDDDNDNRQRRNENETKLQKPNTIHAVCNEMKLYQNKNDKILCIEVMRSSSYVALLRTMAMKH